MKRPNLVIVVSPSHKKHRAMIGRTTTFCDIPVEVHLKVEFVVDLNNRANDSAWGVISVRPDDTAIHEMAVRINRCLLLLIKRQQFRVPF